MNLARILVPILILALTGCSKNIQNKDAVKKAVLEYFAKRADLSVTNMDIDVANVTFKDKDAEAVVSIKPKGMDPSAGMQFRYVLEQKGGQWVVKGKANSGASQHGGGMAMPETKMPLSHPPLPDGTDPGPTKK